MSEKEEQKTDVKKTFVGDDTAQHATAPDKWYLKPADESEPDIPIHQIVDEVIVGRSHECNIVLDDRRASKKHARLFIRDKTLFVEDLESSNGTFLNGVQITAHRLAVGDTIQFAGSAFQVTDSDLQRAPIPWYKDPNMGPKATVLAKPGASSQDSGPYEISDIDVVGPSLVDPHSYRVYPLNQNSATTIGRAEKNDIHFADETMSETHAEIINKAGAWKVVDRFSANETFVNGERVSEKFLNNNDLIMLGNVRLRFVLGANRRNGIQNDSSEPPQAQSALAKIFRRLKNFFGGNA